MGHLHGDANPLRAGRRHVPNKLHGFSMVFSWFGVLLLGASAHCPLAVGTGEVLHTYAYDSEDFSLPLQLTPEANSSRLLGGMSPPLRKWITEENLTSNLHHDGVPPEEFTKNTQLNKIFKVLSTNWDRKGKTFVSTIEGRDRPIFGTQFHPERPLFSWAPEEGINHSPHAVEVMQYFGNFFLSQARMNSHKFRSKQEEAEALIYNYIPMGHSSYQCYTFQKGPKAVNSVEPMLV